MKLKKLTFGLITVAFVLGSTGCAMVPNNRNNTRPPMTLPKAPKLPVPKSDMTPDVDLTPGVDVQPDINMEPGTNITPRVDERPGTSTSRKKDTRPTTDTTPRNNTMPKGNTTPGTKVK